MSIQIGKYKMATDVRRKGLVAVCVNCSWELSWDHLAGKDRPIVSNETGYIYCSDECAIIHVKAHNKGLSRIHSSDVCICGHIRASHSLVANDGCKFCEGCKRFRVKIPETKVQSKTPITTN